MRCEHVQDRLLESLMSGAEDPPAGLKPHLDQCPRCVAELERLRRGLAAARLVPSMAVEPPAGMKDAVFAAILEPAPGAAAEAKASPEPTRKERAESGGGPSWFALALRGLLVRPLPLAAAMCVLVVGALGVYAGQKIGKTKDANVIVQKVNDSPALRDLDRLSHAPWIQEKEVHRTAVMETIAQLQQLAESKDDPRAVESARQVIRDKKLIAAFRALQGEAPASSEGDAKLASEVRMLLEDIVNTDS